MEILSDPAPDMLAMPRFDDGVIDMQELLRRLSEQLCGSGTNSRNGYRERSLATCVGTLTLHISKLCSGSLFPENVNERHRRVDRAPVTTVDEMYATDTGTRKLQRVAEKMGVSRLLKSQVNAITSSLDADSEELFARLLDGSSAPCVKCRCGGRVASTAVVTAIDCDADGWRRVLGVDTVTPSPTARGWPFTGRSATAALTAWSSSSRTPTRSSSARSTRSSGAPHGSAAPSASCSTACAGRAPSSSGAAWTGSSRRCSAGATPPPWPPCTMQRATCWRGFARGRRRAGGGRAGCPGVHRLPSVALEAPAHESIQRSCNIRLPF